MCKSALPAQSSQLLEGKHFAVIIRILSLLTASWFVGGFSLLPLLIPNELVHSGISILTENIDWINYSISMISSLLRIHILLCPLIFC